ncbi:MAG: 5'-methylthioadenosine/S-adenosylhomocysteine nucleosidase [Saprospiraceae bacterium]|nr:5'-methylthioadenosine/S-adenosylhomocysteine nucleosidase [Saprospiraceae bacterium]
MNVALLTPILVEHNAIMAHLPALSEQMIDGNRYLLGSFEGKFHSFNVITHQSGSKNENTALATERIIRQFNPLIVILAGVAGGVKDVEIGDLVIGTKYYGYEFGKVTPTGFAARPESGQYSKELLTLAQSVAGNGNWRKRAKNATESKVVFGAIAAGNKVIAATDSDAYRLLKQTYNDTTAIEMEAIGFGQAMQSYPSIRFLNVRGISDLLDGKSKSDVGGSQELAAAHMAAFVFELLYQLDISQFKIFGGMDVKELSKQIIGLILPIVKLDAVKEIGDDFKDATNGTVRELWKKVKPLFIEEYEELKKEPDDVDAQADARSELKRALEGKEDLKREIEGLVKRIKEEKPSGFNNSGTITVNKAKNVMIGGSISADGNVYFGDIKGK